MANTRQVPIASHPFPVFVSEQGTQREVPAAGSAMIQEEQTTLTTGTQPIIMVIS